MIHYRSHYQRRDDAWDERASTLHNPQTRRTDEAHSHYPTHSQMTSFKSLERRSLSSQRSGVGPRSTLLRAVFRAFLSLFLSLPGLEFKTAAAQPDDLQFHHVAVEAGLPSDVITSILQDNRGFLWFGTSKGLGRYDGYTFHVPRDTTSPRGDFVYALYRDSTPFIWIATIGGGLKRYDPICDVFVQYKHDAADRNTLRSDSVYSVFRDHAGQMWIGTFQGLDRFDSSTHAFVRAFPDTLSLPDSIPNQVTSICECSSLPGVLWLGTLGGGLVRYDCLHSTARRYLHSARDANSLSHNSVRFVREAPGFPLILWIGTEGGGLDRFELSREQFTFFKSEVEPPPRQGFDFVRSMYQDHSGGMWLGTRGGLSWFNPTTGESVHYENNPINPKTIVNGHVNDIYEDQNGTYWVGTRGGLDRFSPKTERIALYQHDPSDPLSLSSNQLYGLLEDRAGFLWIASWGGGLNRYDPVAKTFNAFRHNVHDPSSLRNDYMKTVYEDKAGTLWVGSAEGILHRFDKNSGKCDAFTILDDARNDFDKIVLSILEDREGIFWIGTDEGLYVFDKITGTHHGVRLSPLAYNGREHPHVTALYEDRHSVLWVGTRDDGLIRYDKNTHTIVSYRQDAGDPHSISHGLIAHIHEDQEGTLWVTTSGGLNRLNAETGKFISFTTADGLPDNMIYGFVQDDAGNFWLSTDNGLCRFNPATKRCKNFGIEDGLQGREFNFNSFCKSKSGRMYFGGNLGLNAFYPGSLPDNPHIPPVVVTMIKAFDKEVRADTASPYLTTITLPYHENYLSFEFAALDFKDPLKNLYAYKLEGLDREWIQCGTRRYTTYSHLEAGTYVFKVKGSNNDGVWNEEGTSIAVIITPPFWSTWWFRAFALVAMFGSVGGTVRYLEIRKMKRRIERLEQERALERERSRISQDMHDEVGASLTKIAIVSELAMKNAGDADGMTTQLQNISQTSREVVDSISAIVWAINPKNDRLDNLAGYLREYASDYFEITPIHCRFDFPDELPSDPLSSVVRRNIFLTVKEAIHNIVKHSAATAVHIRLSLAGRQLEIGIEDNGKGFLMEDISRYGNGLNNMRKRIESINGKFDIQSQPGGGTKISFIVPVTQGIPL